MQQVVRQNFEEKATYLARVAPGMAVVDGRSFILADCGLPSDTFNTIVARDLHAPERLLAEGVGYFMARRRPMALWYWDDPADRAGMQALTAYGLHHAETHVAMWADLRETARATTPPAALRISAVEQASELRAYGALLADLFGDSDEGRAVAAYFERLSASDPRSFPALRHYLGTDQGTVVATGLLFVGRDSIGIYDIVTAAPYRRRGIGSAMFGHLLAAARASGRRYAVLQASADGLGIYQRAGFAPTGEVHVFENRALL